MLDRDKYLSPEEGKRLLEYCEAMSLRDLERGKTYWPRRYMVIDFLLNTGCRATETRHLKCGDTALSGREPCVSVNGKGGRRRTIPISTKLAKHMKQYLKWKELLGESVAPEAYFFVNRLGRHYTLMGVQQLFKKCCRDCGLRPVYSIHSTRHAYGFATFSKSKNIRLTQVLLGHRRLGTTEIYTHIDPAEMVETVNSLW
ncbi:MAG: site-specific integrase [Desulfobacterales bacterium]|nr:site-specific integrase [Desulfobacterales bacterium]